jgi:mannitol/fructose-specific phosphotransferase system IIA component (Ntr-type)
VRITDFLSPKHGVHVLKATEPVAAIREIGAALARSSDLEPERLIELLLRREQVCTTAVGNEVAIPHARTPEAGSTVAVIGLAAHGIDFRAPDGLPVRVLAAFVSPIHGGRHLQAIATISRTLGDAALRRQLLEARAPAEVYQLLGGSRA